MVKGDWRPLSQGGVWRDVPAAAVSAKPAPVEIAPARLEGDGSGYALLAFPSLRMYDGRGGTSAWLQESPDPITSVAWDAWVEIADETATSLGIARGDVVKVTSPFGAIELPAYPRRGCIQSVAIRWARTRVSRAPLVGARNLEDPVALAVRRADRPPRRADLGVPSHSCAGRARTLAVLRRVRPGSSGWPATSTGRGPESACAQDRGTRSQHVHRPDVQANRWGGRGRGRCVGCTD